MRSKRIAADYLRSIVFGLEDGLVSTTGAVVGISVGSQDKELVILAGLVIIAVEAISMSAGQFLSEEAVHELEGGRHTDSVAVSALMMFLSYALAGIIPILPFFLLPLASATLFSVVAALISLFLLGYFKARITKVNTLRSGLEILLVGGLATTIGVVVGIILKV